MQPLIKAEALDMQTLLQTLGRSAPVLFVPSDKAEDQRLAVYGLLSTPGSVSHSEAELYRAEFDVAEVGG